MAAEAEGKRRKANGHKGINHWGDWMDKQTAETVVKVLAVLGFIFAGLGAIGGLIVIFGGSMMGAYMGGMLPFGGALWAGMAVVVGIVMIAFAVLYFFVARGLWNHENWARIVVMILEILGLFSFPVGTIIAIAVIYLLGFNADITALFGAKPFADLGGSGAKAAPARKSKSK